MLRVLIVDDEFKSRALLKVLLETYGENVAVVGTAENVQAGRETVLHLLPDVLRCCWTWRWARKPALIYLNNCLCGMPM